MKIVCAILYAVAVATLLAVFGAARLTPSVAGWSLAAGALVGAVSLWSQRREPCRRPRLSPWEWVAIVAFTLFALRAFLWVVFFVGDGVCVLSPNNLGDISLHLTYINQLANGARLWPENPILANASLTYPLGVDLFHSLLVLAGANLWRTFVWMGLASSALTLAALWRWGRGFAIAGFLGNGGLAGFAILYAWKFEDYQGPHAWKSIPLALFVTQRGLLYALPAGLVLLTSWRARFFRTAEKPMPFAGELLLYAAMPLFHLHTFIALSLLLGVWFLAEAATRRTILPLVLGAIVPATLLVALVTNRFQAPSSLGWHPGWMQDDSGFLDWCTAHLGTTAWPARVPAFWLLNFGALPAFLALLLWRLWRTPPEPEPGARSTVLFALGLFVLCCFVKFAVWEWDNTKLMLWSYLLVLPYLDRSVIAPQALAWRVVAIVLLFGSGFVSLIGGLAYHREEHPDDRHGIGFGIASRQELISLAWSLRDISPDARFVANPTYNHPLLLLGHPLAMGYAGHVSSHGYAYEKPLAQVNSILAGDEGWLATARSLHCRYLLWGPMEIAAFPNSSQPWRDAVPCVGTGVWGSLYDLESPAERGQNEAPAPDIAPNAVPVDPPPPQTAPSPL